MKLVLKWTLDLLFIAVLFMILFIPIGRLAESILPTNCGDGMGALGCFPASALAADTILLFVLPILYFSLLPRFMHGKSLGELIVLKNKDNRNLPVPPAQGQDKPL